MAWSFAIAALGNAVGALTTATIDKLVRKIIGPIIDEFKYDDNTEKKYEIRNLILVIVTLIAGVTFQAGINPPGGLWQDNQKEQVAGTAIFAYRKQAAFYVFLVFNTLAFTTSAFTIFCFTQGFPFSPEIRLAVVSVVVTYACAVSAIIPPESANLAYVLLVALLPIVVLSWIRRRVRGE
ncbi:hypothetical protein SLEP1_g14073 [Rubroshorea leprosula]|uniref:PGG domain-containing protein n=1 Tax=Rubroshorea leprosula TaxID=152421 RepID=A0AAV5ITG4_9ROSI|nr:hypothetical protein SLEP1_g14073 [Rubroshorea leprosula]